MLPHLNIILIYTCYHVILFATHKMEIDEAQWLKGMYMRISLIMRRFSWLSAVIVLIALVLVIFIIHPAIEPPKSTSAIASNTWTTTHIFSGTGKFITASFTVAHHWRIIWSCEKSPTPYNFSLLVNDAFTQQTIDIPVNTTCHARQSGVINEQKGSYIFLLIYSYTGTWHIAIQEMK